MICLRGLRCRSRSRGRAVRGVRGVFRGSRGWLAIRVRRDRRAGPVRTAAMGRPAPRASRGPRGLPVRQVLLVLLALKASRARLARPVSGASRGRRVRPVRMGSPVRTGTACRRRPGTRTRWCAVGTRLRVMVILSQVRRSRPDLSRRDADTDEGAPSGMHLRVLACVSTYRWRLVDPLDTARDSPTRSPISITRQVAHPV